MDRNKNVELLEFELKALFTLKETSVRKNKCPILSPSMNLKAHSKNNMLGGFGIYGITFNPTSKDEYLIYLGKFQGSAKYGRFGGNIVLDRWQNHLYTITMRGHNVAVDSEKAFDRVRQIADYSALQQGDSFISLTGEAKSKLFQKNGCQASLNRMMFALQNEHLLLPNKEHPDHLEHCYKLFKFYYWRVYEKTAVESLCKKVDLSEIEDALISEFSDRLPCNKEYKKSNNSAVSYIHYNQNQMIMKNSLCFECLSEKIYNLLYNGIF